jgi:hypothetical protein
MLAKLETKTSYNLHTIPTLGPMVQRVVDPSNDTPERNQHQIQEA